MGRLKQEFRDFMGAIISFPQDFFGVFGLPPSESGAIVNEMSALQIAAYFACVRVISDAVGTLELNVHERMPDGGERLATDHYLYPILHDAPNPESAAPDVRQAAQAHCLMTGNAYIEIDWTVGGQVKGLYLRSPFSTFPYRNSMGGLIYKTHDNPNGAERTVLADEMIHVKGMGIDSLLGLSPIKYYAREVLGMDIAAQSYANQFFAHGARPDGVLTAPGNLTDQQRLDNMRTWIDAHGKGRNHYPALLEAGWKWEQTSIDPTEAMLIQVRNMNRSQICSIFGVPEHMAGGQDVEKANMEQKAAEFLTFTLKPWLRKWESAINWKLFPTVGRSANKYFCKFDTKALEQANYADKVKGLQMARYAGGITRDELRKELGYNPAKPDDKFLLPINMQVIDEEKVQSPAPAPTEGGGIGGNTEPNPGGKPEEVKSNKPFTAFYPAFRDAFGRILTRKKPDANDFQRVFMPVLVGVASTFDFASDDPVMSGDTVRMVASYIDSMAHRAKSWSAADADQQATEELKRAITYLSEKVQSEPELQEP